MKALLLQIARVPMQADDTAGWEALSEVMGERVGPEPPWVPMTLATCETHPGDYVARLPGGSLLVFLGDMDVDHLFNVCMASLRNELRQRVHDVMTAGM